MSCMQFHGSDPTREPTRLMSGSVDGNIIIWSVGQWDALKTMKAHRGGVHALSVHRSGLVAMSAGADLLYRHVGHEKGTSRSQDQAQDQARAPGLHPER